MCFPRYSRQKARREPHSTVVADANTLFPCCDVYYCKFRKKVKIVNNSDSHLPNSELLCSSHGREQC